MNKNDQVTTIISFVFFLILVFFFVITLAIRYRKRKKENEELKVKFLEERLRIQVEIQEETLQQISRELHDNLGQVASLIKINLNTLVLSDTSKASEKIEATKELTRQLITDIKSLSVSLGNDRIAQVGFPRALATEVQRLNNTEQFIAVYHEEGEFPPIKSDIVIILFRMVQEVLNNMVKHSNAKQISVSLFSTEKNVTLVLSDDGVGFDVENQIYSLGNGLRNLQKRAQYINAELLIKSSINIGTNVTISLQA